MSWTCPCGTSNRTDITSCRRCGYQLFQSTSPERFGGQARSSRWGLKAAMLLGCGALGLAILVLFFRVPANRPTPVHPTGSQEAAKSGGSPAGGDPVDSGPQQVSPNLDKAERDRLIRERANLNSYLATYHAILRAESFVERAELLCKSTVPDAESLISINGMSGA